MVYLVLVALLGGAASVLTPCVLPLLPALLIVSGGEGRRRTWGLVAGIEVSFFVIAILLSAALRSLGLPDSALVILSAVLLGAFGLVLIVPKLGEGFERAVSLLVSKVPVRSREGSGFVPGFLTGVPLGLVWAPCAGPILAGITIAASSSRLTNTIVVTMVAYAAGMFGPLSAVVFGGAKAAGALKRRLGGGRRVMVPMGAILLATAVLVGSGGLTKLDKLIASSVSLTSTPTAGLEKKALAGASSKKPARLALAPEELARNGYPELEGISDLGPAPEFTGISTWYNTPGGAPLTMAGLRGKVVLVDVWTYSCINCIRTLPHVEKWYETYKGAGFVVVGLHTPEFGFERDPANVGKAVKDFGLTYPVALDPDAKTWDRYYNRYWPAHYLIDRNGNIRSAHYGEGAYARTENEIRTLLSMPANLSESGDAAGGPSALTPETYLGYRRAERFVGTTGGQSAFAPDKLASYSAPTDQAGVSLDADAWAYGGSWTVGSEKAVAGPGATIWLHFRAGKVHIVAGPGASGSGTIQASGASEAASATVDGYRLYTVRSGNPTEGTLRLDVSPGVEVFSFTFG